MDKGGIPVRGSTSVDAVAPSVRRRRSSVLYHEVVVPSTSQIKIDSKGYTSAHHSDSGYKRQASSDEYKKKKYEEKEQEKEVAREPEDYSLRFWLIVFFFTTIGVLLAMWLAYYTWNLRQPPRQSHKPKLFSFESERSTLAIASDNIDCSIYMKQCTLMSEDFMGWQEGLLQGMLCLYLTEPHSSAPDSGISMLMYYSQGRTYLAESIMEKRIKPNCKNDINDNSCGLRNFNSLRAGFVELDKPIVDSDFYGQVMLNGPDWYRKTYQTNFRHLFRAFDHGPKVLPSVKLTEGYQPIEAIPHFHRTRVFQVSNRTAELWRHSKLPVLHLTEKWADIFRNETNNKNPFERKAHFHGTRKIAQHTMNKFFHPSQPRKVHQENVVEVSLDVNGPQDDIYRLLVIPKGRTMSIVSAMVIRMVYAAHEKKSINTEAEFYGIVLLSQHYAYNKLVTSQEWNNSTKPSLLSKQSISDAVAWITRDSLTKLDVPKEVTRLNPDRVASIVNWRQGGRDLVGIMNVGLPKLFDSEDMTGKKRSGFSGFRLGKEKSDSFMSSAGIILLRRKVVHAKTQVFTDCPTMLSTSSGSVRTVEAVVIPMLRMLIFNDDPGKAVTAPSAYYDLRDNRFYCEQRSSAEDELFSGMSSRFGLPCSPISTADVAANDRISIAYRRDAARHDQTPVKAAVNDRYKEYNYVVGF